MKPVHFLTVLFLILNILSQPAGAQGFSWAQGFTPANSSNYAAIATLAFDAQNNAYSVGGTNGTVDLNWGPNTHNMTAIGNSLFLLKEDAAGNFIWAREFLGMSFGVNGFKIWAMDFDVSGNIYIAGSVRDSFDLDPGPGIYNFSTGNALVAFILKLDSLGNFIWIKAHQVAAVNNNVSGFTGMKIIGNAIYAVGAILGTVDIDPGTGVTNITSMGVNDILLTKLDTAGNFLWGKTMGGANNEGAVSLATDSSVNLYIVGHFEDTVDFNPDNGVYKMVATPPMNPCVFGCGDIFVAKYDSAGSFQWAKRAGSGFRDLAWKVAVDRWGDVLVTGDFGGTVDFDPGAGTHLLSSNSTRSIFTLKLRNNGDFAWAQKAGYGAGLYEGRGIATDTAGQVYVVSNTYPLQKFDSTGQLLWELETAGTAGWICLDNENSIYLSGSFTGTQDFDPGSGVYNLTAASPGGGFILKLHYDSTFTSIHNPETSGAALKVYPNPGNGIFKFTSSSRMEQLIITDMTGKAIYRAQPNKNEYITDLSGHAAGIYFYQITTNKGKESGKLILGNKE